MWGAFSISVWVVFCAVEVKVCSGYVALKWFRNLLGRDVNVVKRWRQFLCHQAWKQDLDSDAVSTNMSNGLEHRRWRTRLGHSDKALHRFRRGTLESNFLES